MSEMSSDPSACTTLTWSFQGTPRASTGLNWMALLLGSVVKAFSREKEHFPPGPVSSPRRIDTAEVESTTSSCGRRGG